MNVHVLNYEPNRTGGGWTQSRYLYEGLQAVPYEEADVVLITGPTMASHEQVVKAHLDGKRIVLRVDNHVLPSRNRNTGMSRMRAFADLSDLVVYQSEWARDYLKPFVGQDGVVILNGADTSIFNTEERKETSHCLYVRSSRIAEKGWEMARYWYSRHFQEDDLGVLNIVGKFSPENLEYKFDFFNNEPYIFYGEQPREKLAELMKSSGKFLYSYFMDACSNTAIEALLCGCELVDIYGMAQTGGMPEIQNRFDSSGAKALSKERMVKEYLEVINGIVL